MKTLTITTTSLPPNCHLFLPLQCHHASKYWCIYEVVILLLFVTIIKIYLKLSYYALVSYVNATARISTFYVGNTNLLSMFFFSFLLMKTFMITFFKSTRNPDVSWGSSMLHTSFHHFDHKNTRSNKTCHGLTQLIATDHGHKKYRRGMCWSDYLQLRVQSIAFISNCWNSSTSSHIYLQCWWAFNLLLCCCHDFCQVYSILRNHSHDPIRN